MNNMQKEILEAIPKEKLIELLLERLDTPQNNQLNRITIDELLNKQLTIAEAKGFTKNTFDKLQHAQKDFRSFIEKKGLTYADEITADHADEFLIHLKNTKNQAYSKRKDASEFLSKATYTQYYKEIKAAFRIAQDRNHITKNPFRNIQAPLKPVTKWWTDDYVYNKLIPAVKSYNPPFIKKSVEPKFYKNKELAIMSIITTHNTGLRIGKLMEVLRKDAHYENGILTLTTTRKTQADSPKRFFTAEILSNEAKDLIVKRRSEIDSNNESPTTPIFHTAPTPHSGYHLYRQILENACKAASIKYLAPHKAKHGFITKAGLAGMTSKQICALTGNLTPSLIDEVYTHIRFEDIKDEASRIINTKKQ